MARAGLYYEMFSETSITEAVAATSGRPDLIFPQSGRRPCAVLLDRQGDPKFYPVAKSQVGLHHVKFAVSVRDHMLGSDLPAHAEAGLQGDEGLP